MKISKRFDSIVEVTANLEVILKDKNLDVIKAIHKTTLSELITMGHLLQEDLCEKLLKQVNQEAKKREDIKEEYLEYISTVLRPLPSPSFIELTGSEFIPKLRGIHGIT